MLKISIITTFHVILFVFFLSIDCGKEVNLNDEFSQIFENQNNTRKVFAVFSEQSSTASAAAAEIAQKGQQDVRFIFRSVEQVALLSDSEITTALVKSDAILFAGVFGDQANRIQSLVKNHISKIQAPIFAISSAVNLVRQSTFQGAEIFSGISQKEYEKIMRQINQGSQSITKALLKNQLQIKEWLTIKSYWQCRGSNNIANLLKYMIHLTGSQTSFEPPIPRKSIRYLFEDKVRNTVSISNKPLIIFLDLDSGDILGNQKLHESLHRKAKARNITPLSIFANWGSASIRALRKIQSFSMSNQLIVIVSIQDFIIGGGGNKNKAIQILREINVPVIKAIRLSKREAKEWFISEDGLSWNSVHYRVSMPELQGVVSPTVVAATGEQTIHKLTGLKLQSVLPIEDQVRSLMNKASKWRDLQNKNNKTKKVAIVFYNHPPGRHNIGADNLDVPASLLQILYSLRNSGYDTGKLPSNAKNLLLLLQQRAVNMPENSPALKSMSKLHKARAVALNGYKSWFKTLPQTVQNEMNYGPLGYLDTIIKKAIQLKKYEYAKESLARTISDIRHFIEGVSSKHRSAALSNLDELNTLYLEMIDSKKIQNTESLLNNIRHLNIEALGGWGPPPGKVMVYDKSFIIPGLVFGNIFLGPQPPRGWEVSEELLHANMALPPTHQYLAFYHWLHTQFKADALIHLGRHSTYEFLPHKRLGLGPDDYSTIIAGDIPGIYPYIVDGVGEGLQAKRRGLATIIDHLTPPLRVTPLYDKILELRQIVESYETSGGQPHSKVRDHVIQSLKNKIKELNMTAELKKSMQEELMIRKITFEEVDDELLVHEVGHYLTELQESFMPEGLHIFGRPWSHRAITMMAKSISESGIASKGSRNKLRISPQLEMTSLLRALNGKFIAPGEGNDPIRTPTALPTGRNFHGISNEVIPTKIAYELGNHLAIENLKKPNIDRAKREAVVLWASDTVRDHGVMIAFGMSLMGIKPKWNSRGIVYAIEAMPLKSNSIRRDVMFTTSGLFRDLYSNLLVWLDRSYLLALDRSSVRIKKKYPELTESLMKALKRLGKYRKAGDEPLIQNLVAANWVRDVQKMNQRGLPKQRAGYLASIRIFGDAPGTYGAGINRSVERSGSWEERKQLGHNYIRRMSHGYGDGLNGTTVKDSFESSLSYVQNTYLGRASNLYGLLDNNDGFDYLGGLSLAVETLTGKAPQNFIIDHSQPDNAKIKPLKVALLQELRGRYFNRNYIRPLMKHGYAGARTMGSEFLEYLWGWQVTNPQVIQSWIWEEVKSVYLDDKLKLNLDKFLEQKQNVHVKINMMAIMLVAIKKGFWKANAETIKELSQSFADLVGQHGLPGSGHTRPDHPIMNWVQNNIPNKSREKFDSVLKKAQGIILDLDSAERQNLKEVELDKTKKLKSTESFSGITIAIAVLLTLVFFGAVARGKKEFYNG